MCTPAFLRRRLANLLVSTGPGSTLRFLARLRRTQNHELFFVSNKNEKAALKIRKRSGESETQ